MSRIENSDDRRIREVNEAADLRKLREAKRDQQARVERSFQQVMQERSKREGDKRATEQHQTRTTGEALVARHRQAAERSAPRTAQEQLRQQLLQSSLQGKQQSVRRQAADDHNQTLGVRRQGFHEEGKVERDVLERLDREDDQHRDVEADERRAEAQLDQRVEAEQQERVERDAERRRESEGRESGEGQDPPASEVQAVGAGAASAPATTLPALIEELVEALYTVQQDGRTSLKVVLKSPGLEGIHVDVKREGRRIHCSFQGCSAEIRTALQGAKDRLRQRLRGLGMELGRLNFA